MKRCPNCGAENPDDAQYCLLCMVTLRKEDGETTGVGRDEGNDAGFTAGVAPEPVIGGKQAPGDWAAYGTAHLRSREAEAAGMETVSLGYSLKICVYAALCVTVASFLIDWGFGRLVAYTMFTESTDPASQYVVFFYLAIAVLAMGCAFYCGYRAGRMGWFFGLLSAFLFLCVFRIVGQLLVCYLFFERTFFPPWWQYIVATAAICLPLSALAGWLGERRITGKL